MNTMVIVGDNLDNEGGAFIPKQLDFARETSGVHTSRMWVRESVNHCLSPSFSNAGLDNDQNIGAMPTVELIGMGLKHLISCSLTILGNHLHGWGKGGEGLIRDSLGSWNPRCGWREALMPRCGSLYAIQCFHVAEPDLMRVEHDKW